MSVGGGVSVGGRRLAPSIRGLWPPTGDRRAAWAAIGIGVAFVLARVVLWRSHPFAAAYADSYEYRHAPWAELLPVLSLTGHAVRPPTVPYFYVLFPDDQWRVTAQVALSTVSWTVLARTAARVLEDRWLRVAAWAVVLLFGVSLGVVNWDNTILSESLTLSLSALALSAWLHLSTRPRPTPAAAIAVALSTVALAFTRTQLIPWLAVLGVVLVIRGVRTTAGRRPVLGAAAVLLVSAAWGSVLIGNVEDTGTIRKEGVGPFAQNFALVLHGRIINDPDTLAWFRDRGMPEPTGMMQIDPLAEDPAAPLRALAADAELLAWVEADGARAMAVYSVVHPEKFPARFFAESPDILVPLRSQVVYFDMQGALPRQLEVFVTPTWEEWSLFLPPVLLFGLVSAAAQLVSARRPGGLAAAPAHRAGLRVLGGAIVVSVVGFYGSWLASPLEPSRHAVPFTTVVPLCLLLRALVHVDAWRRARPGVT